MPPEVIDLLSSSPGTAQAAVRPRASQSTKISHEHINELWNAIDDDFDFLRDEDDLAGINTISQTHAGKGASRAAATIEADQDIESRETTNGKRKRDDRDMGRDVTEHLARANGFILENNFNTPARRDELSAARNAFLDRVVSNNQNSPIVITSPAQDTPGWKGTSHVERSVMPPSSPPRHTSPPKQQQHLGDDVDRRPGSPLSSVIEERAKELAERLLAASKPETWSDLSDPLDPENGTFNPFSPKQRPKKKKKRTSIECIDMTAPEPAFNLFAPPRSRPVSPTRSESSSDNSYGSRPGSKGSSFNWFFRITKAQENGTWKKKPEKGPQMGTFTVKHDKSQQQTNKSTTKDDTILFTSDAIDPTTAHDSASSRQALSKEPVDDRKYGDSSSGEKWKHSLPSVDPIETSAPTTQPRKRSSKTADSSRTSTLSLFDIRPDPIGISSDTDFDIDEDISFEEPRISTSQNLSVLEKIRKLNQGCATKSKKGKSKAHTTRKSEGTETSGSDKENHTSSSSASLPKQTQAPQKRATQPKLTAEERAARAAERQQQKEAEKAAKAKQRQAEKEERQRLKILENELTEVNRRQRDRKQSALEIIVDLPKSFDDNLKVIAKQCFDIAQVETTFVESAVPDVVTFRRKLTREWDAKNYTFRPIPQRIVREPHAICVLKAKDLARLVEAEACGDGDGVDYLAKRIDTTHPKYNQLYIIEGLSQLFKTRANRAQKEFAEQVRGALTQAPAPAQPQRRRNNTQTRLPDVSEEQIEDALQHLEVEHFAKISHTSSSAETVTLIHRLTEYISFIRHSPEETTLADARTSFCLAAGQFSTGADARDAYVKMLQQPGAISEAIAKDIARAYPGTLDLIKVFETHGPTALQDVERTRNSSRAVERIGKALSERLYATMMGGDMDAFI
ncbi:hypothetical protein KEM56_001113 [Ascosphaera pollenicola]|nr:hypothetical protein KEM56_001113 [Ascosphaera pollenicola]